MKAHKFLKNSHIAILNNLGATRKAYVHSYIILLPCLASEKGNPGVHVEEGREGGSQSAICNVGPMVIDPKADIIGTCAVLLSCCCFMLLCVVCGVTSQMNMGGFFMKLRQT